MPTPPTTYPRVSKLRLVVPRVIASKFAFAHSRRKGGGWEKTTEAPARSRKTAHRKADPLGKLSLRSVATETFRLKLPYKEVASVSSLPLKPFG